MKQLIVGDIVKISDKDLVYPIPFFIGVVVRHFGHGIYQVRLPDGSFHGFYNRELELIG